MKIHRMIPPAAAPLSLQDIYFGFMGLFTRDRFLKKLINELKAYFSVNNVYLLSSGKAALTIILKALHSKDSRNEVIIPAYTCFSVPSSVINAGLQVTLCDLQENSFDYNYEELENLITDNTLCVVTSNLFGIPSDLDKLKVICEQNNIYLIEDAAQAMGVKHNDQYLGCIGDAGFFSFGRGKNITCNSGGLILTNNDDLSHQIERAYSEIQETDFLDNVKELFATFIMHIFINPRMYWFPSSLPFLKLGQTFFYENFDISKLSEMKAGLLYNWKKRLEKSNEVRIKNSNEYTSLNVVYPYIRFPLILENANLADKLYTISKEKGLGLSKLYPSSIDKIEKLKGRINEGEFPVASSLSDRLIALPTHPLLNKQDIERIKGLIKNYI